MTTSADSAELLRLRRERNRLSRSKSSLNDFLHRLETLHADRSGAFRQMYPRVPLIPDEWKQHERSLARTTRDALNGCPLCIAWLEQTSELRARIDTLRNTPLPGRAADYSGRWVWPTEALKAGKKRKPCPFRDRALNDGGRIVREYIERMEARQAERSGSRAGGP